MKISEMTLDQLKDAIRNRELVHRDACTWQHKDKRMSALLNEHERRVMG